ncbi:MAG: DUF2156 domain-containing protein [Ruminococcaceae bacterium]|nr:DUF2156 domain-containing protein [Oscillospiraceae bacterium]
MNFKKIELGDKEKLEAFFKSAQELTCEIAFINLLIWQPLYNNYYCIEDDTLYLKTCSNNNESYSVPFGNVAKGLEKIIKSENNFPNIWAQEGERFQTFKRLYGEYYDFHEIPSEFDYIYNSSDLINLSGKKYHSKRNHISSFSKQFNWHYEDIASNNIEKVRECARIWYRQHNDDTDVGLTSEMHGIDFMLKNMDTLDVTGGAIIVDNRVVAFTLGSPINNNIYDIHIEKAILGYETAYTVINREFASHNLNDYRYINRENDLGIDGLRKSKLSYKPEIILPKYLCTKKESI